MLASIIPFFLVARLAVDESVWKYGPEYVFDVEMNMTTVPLNNDEVQRSNYTVMNMFCRPKGSDKLSCHLGNARRHSMDVTNDNTIDIPDEEMKHLCNEEPFEIKFNEHGIDHLTMNDRVPVNDMNDVKLIVERLNIGVDLNGIPDGTFTTYENTTIGRCSVTVGFNHYPSKRTMGKMNGPRYELESLPQLNKVPSEVITIHKTINLSNCSNYASFYFGSYGDNVVVEKDLHSHLISSISHQYVSDHQFVSTLTRAGTLGSKKMNNLTKMLQKITLTLRDIRAAKRELAEIPEPSRTTILVNSDVEKIVYSMK